MNNANIERDDDNETPIERLASAWSSYPPVPDFGSFITEEVRADEDGLIALVRKDAQERVHRDEPVRLEFYAEAISAEMLAPGSVLAQLVLGYERMAGGKATDIRKRIGEKYESDIGIVFTRDETLPPTGVGESDADDEDDATASLPNGSSAETHLCWKKGDRVGQFTLILKIGQGAFGEVWYAERKKPRLRASIKLLHPSASNASKARFESEAQALARLRHPYIAGFLNSGTEQGEPFIAIEYIEGKPLTKYCDDREFTLRQRLELMAQICVGMQHAHQNKVLHRNLKPDNILVTEITKHPRDLDDHELQLVVQRSETEVTIAIPKIVDFSLAKTLDPNAPLQSLSDSLDYDMIMGPLAYMAPEQAGHEALEVNQQADIFSLGVILFELLTGTLPLDPEELKRAAVDKAVSIVRDTPRPEPSTRFGKLDADTVKRVSYQRGEIGPKVLGRLLRGRVRHLCSKAMRLKSRKRFSAAAIMALDIRNYLSGKDFVEAASEPLNYRLWRNTKRRILELSGRK